MNKAFLFLLNISFLYSVSLFGAEHVNGSGVALPVEQEQNLVPLMGNTQDDNGQQRGMPKEQVCSICASGSALWSSVFSGAATISVIRDGRPGSQLTNNSWKDVTDLISKGCGLTAVLIDWKSDRQSREKFFSFEDSEPATLTFALLCGSGAGILSAVANYVGDDNENCAKPGHACYRMSQAKNSLNVIGLASPLAVYVVKKGLKKSSVRPYNRETKLKALQRDLGWISYGLSCVSSVCSWYADSNPEQDASKYVALVRDIFGFAASSGECAASYETSLMWVIDRGWFEDPGKKLVESLPEDALIKDWIELVCTSCWDTQQIQIEYLKHPETKKVIGLEFVRENQTNSRVSILFGKIRESEEGSRFTFFPGLDSNIWIIGGKTFRDLDFTDSNPSICGVNERLGVKKFHDAVSDSLRLPDTFVLDERRHQGSLVKSSGNQFMYKSFDSEDQNIDILLIIPFFNSENSGS